MVVNEAQIPGTKIELYSTLLDTLNASQQYVEVVIILFRPI